MSQQETTIKTKYPYSNQELTGSKQTIKFKINNSYRRIKPFHQSNSHPSNLIRTSKYTWYDFLPKNIFQQFTKLPNIYFLIISVLQIIPFTTNTQGIPFIFIPLGVILVLSAVTNIYEDWHRSGFDNMENNQIITQIIDNGQRKDILSKDIKVGMILVVQKGDNIPCDGIIMKPMQEPIYVSTKNLDGQTNYKRKYAHSDIKDYFNCQKEGIISCDQLVFQCQPPNNNLLSFSGSINQTEYIHSNNIVLRSSKLQGPKQIVILAIYTGHQTKMLLNMNKPTTKKTLITKKLGYTVLFVFIFVILVSLAISCATLKYSKRGQHQAIHFIKYWGSWILNLSNYVPISLLVTVEIVTVLQGKLIEKDYKLFTQDIKPTVNVSSVLEDLGAIQYLASDKTGTLTKNVLKFKQLAVCGKIYYENDKISQDKIMKALCICHETSVSQQGQFQSVSQDEIQILNYCKQQNYILTHREQNSITFKSQNIQRTFEILKTIEFSSQRKRQSVIIKEGTDFFIYCKGADDIMKSKIINNNSKQEMYYDVNSLASMGRRTLVYAYKQLNKQALFNWLQFYKSAYVFQDFIRIKQLQQQLETQLFALCATGIEDQLQDEVAQTIQTIVSAGIKVVIISGDKPQTVMSIAQNLHVEGEIFLANSKQYLPIYDKKSLVVFARCTPKQKSSIIKSMNGRVLAIGDGANDVAMLTAASIGVGIKGKQGMAASQAADIAVSQFKHLNRLIFYYGIEINRRNSTLISYNFYKNFIYTIPQLAFGMYSNFTGVALYQPIIAQVFNLFYTAFPISAFALFDQSQQQQVLLKNQNNIYLQKQQSQTYSYFNFMLLLIQSHAQAFLGCYIFFSLSQIISPNELNLYQISTVLIFEMIILTNHKIIQLVRKLTIGFLIVLSIGIVSYFASVEIISIITYNIRGIRIWKTLIIVIMSFMMRLLISYFSYGLARLIKMRKTQIINPVIDKAAQLSQVKIKQIDLTF